MIFPITNTIVQNGKETVRQLRKGDVVKCYYCGKPIKVNFDTVCEMPNGYKAIKCQNDMCQKTVSVLYYYDRKIPKEKTNVRRRKNRI